MLSEFLGCELVEKLARLERHRIFGAWEGGNPSEVRQKAQFAPVLYGEEHSHPHQEACLLLSGQCRFSFQHRVSILKAGDMILCPAHVPARGGLLQQPGGLPARLVEPVGEGSDAPCPPLSAQGRL